MPPNTSYSPAPFPAPLNSAPFSVNSDHVDTVESNGNHYMRAFYEYASTRVDHLPNGSVVAVPTRQQYEFRTNLSVPRVGVMLVGWGGNNGSTLTASLLAHRAQLSWHTREGLRNPTWFGSLCMASTIHLGIDSATGREVYVPFRDVLPMLNPTDIVIGGWDINNANLAQACHRARVLEYDLIQQLEKDLAVLQPLPGIYRPDFIARNQETRANNVIYGSLINQMEIIRNDIRNFKSHHQLDKVIVVWTANTERFVDIIPGVNDTATVFMDAINNDHDEIAPSSLYAVASILEGAPFINGSPQNTFVPGLIQLAEQHGGFIAGDDFKSGQTKLKSVLVDFLVGAGIKPLAVTSYNHLGNNDGYNLSSERQFRSKELSKRNVVDDVVDSNPIMFKPGESPDHVVVIKYVPSVGDSKRALDEYVSEIFMGGKSTIAIYNVCEDSLLATPLIIDLIILAELFTRIQYRIDSSTGNWHGLGPIMSFLAFMLKAPVVNGGEPIVNALNRQRAALINILRACRGLPPVNDMLLELRL